MGCPCVNKRKCLNYIDKIEKYNGIDERWFN